MEYVNFTCSTTLSEGSNVVAAIAASLNAFFGTEAHGTEGIINIDASYSYVKFSNRSCIETGDRLPDQRLLCLVREYISE